MPCKITKTTEHRKISLKEYKKQKGYGDYKKYRQIAKAENFSLIFGGSASVLSSNSLELEWSEKDVDAYLSNYDCSKELEEVKSKYPDYPEERQKYIACATRMRTQFFKGYPGLLTRCDREVDYAYKHGYCRSEFGAKRSMIELHLKGEGDKRTEGAKIRNLENICKNFKAQNFEACIRGKAMTDINNWLIKRGYKGRVWNETHDSIDMWVDKDKANEILPHVKHVLERKVPELEEFWLPLPADCSVSDLKQGQYYKGEFSPESHGINWDNGYYEDCDPFGVELLPKYETEYFDERAKYWEEKGEIDPLARKIYQYRKEKGV